MQMSGDQREGEPKTRNHIIPKPEGGLVFESSLLHLEMALKHCKKTLKRETLCPFLTGMCIIIMSASDIPKTPPSPDLLSFDEMTRNLCCVRISEKTDNGERRCAALVKIMFEDILIWSGTLVSSGESGDAV